MLEQKSRKNMNNKTRKLEFIRYKNQNKKTYPAPKWRLKNRKYPYIWINTCPGLLEESWVCDMIG